MITRVYEVSCDTCNHAISHYVGGKPTQQDLKEDGVVVVKTDEGVKHFCCTTCYQDYVISKRK